MTRRSDGEEISAEEIDGELVELENEDIVTRAFEDVPAKKAGKTVNARELTAQSALYRFARDGLLATKPAKVLNLLVNKNLEILP